MIFGSTYGIHVGVWWVHDRSDVCVRMNAMFPRHFLDRWVYQTRKIPAGLKGGWFYVHVCSAASNYDNTPTVLNSTK